VKPKTGAQEHRDPRSDTPGNDHEPSHPPALVELSDDQKRVLDCLHAAGSGLTLRQLEAKTSRPLPALEEALDGLLAKNLVARLNTLIPSYAYRYPGVRIYAE
jgi:hypothetical protein